MKSDRYFQLMRQATAHTHDGDEGRQTTTRGWSKRIDRTASFHQVSPSQDEGLSMEAMGQVNWEDR